MQNLECWFQQIEGFEGHGRDGLEVEAKAEYTHYETRGSWGDTALHRAFKVMLCSGPCREVSTYAIQEVLEVGEGVLDPTPNNMTHDKRLRHKRCRSWRVMAWCFQMTASQRAQVYRPISGKNPHAEAL